MAGEMPEAPRAMPASRENSVARTSSVPRKSPTPTARAITARCWKLADVAAGETRVDGGAEAGIEAIDGPDRPPANCSTTARASARRAMACGCRATQRRAGDGEHVGDGQRARAQQSRAAPTGRVGPLGGGKAVAAGEGVRAGDRLSAQCLWPSGTRPRPGAAPSCRPRPGG